MRFIDLLRNNFIMSCPFQTLSTTLPSDITSNSFIQIHCRPAPIERKLNRSIHRQNAKSKIVLSKSIKCEKLKLGHKPLIYFTRNSLIIESRKSKRPVIEKKLKRVQVDLNNNINTIKPNRRYTKRIVSIQINLICTQCPCPKKIN